MLFRFFTLAVMIFLFASCGEKILRPPPDFSTGRNQVRESSIELRGISIKINQEFAELDAAMKEVRALNEMAFSDSFPKNLFKHALMACLNQTAPVEEISESAKFLGLSCNVLPLKDLIESLRGSENLSVAKKGMRSLEIVRQERNRIQDMIQKIPDRVSKIRDDVNIRKGELRRRRDAMQAKRNDYSDKEWEIAQNAVQVYEKDLDELQTLTRTLALNKQLWFQKLGSEIDVLYKSIAELGERE